MQTILGSGGVIGYELARSLMAYTDRIRLVSRNPVKVQATDELFPCDLLDRQGVERAVSGSSVAYLMAGLPYALKVWQEQWPVVMRNVIDACKIHNTKLVFFDNVYMIDIGSIGHITEESPVNPPSKKGKVRAEIDRMILQEVEKGQLQAIIARSADFYGPNITAPTSVLLELVYKNFLKGSPANWFCSLDKKHSFTYTQDAGRATAILGNDASAYNQVWNLPTAADPLTGREWIDLFAREMGIKPKRMVATRFMVRFMGLFMPVMRELGEMLYQYDRDYVFDSSKFERAYNFQPTSYQDGVRAVVADGTKPS